MPPTEFGGFIVVRNRRKIAKFSHRMTGSEFARVAREVTMSTYRHIQKAPWFLLLLAFGILCAAVTWAVPDGNVLKLVFPVVSFVFLVLAAAFQHLAVEDEGDSLSIHFGPLPMFHRRIRYDEILDVEPGQTTFLDGWGIHMSLKGGWVWNIWGRACVVIRMRRDTLRIGTDDVENLVRFLREKMGERIDSRNLVK